MKRNWIARIPMGVAAAGTVLFTFWLGKLDFTQRGFELAYCFIVTVLALLFGLSCPLFDRENET
jgi:hypothetical protein